MRLACVERIITLGTGGKSILKWMTRHKVYGRVNPILEIRFSAGVVFPNVV
jgi:hypothetical protein